MSFVPARITTTFGASAMTSWRNRTSIWAVVWPPMPRFTYGLPGNALASAQMSVIESPKNTTRVSPGAFLARAALAAAKRASRP
jgi:hypothetical protein